MSLIVVQMGHCFRKTGATGTNGVDGNPNEQTFAHLAALAAAGRIEALGHQVRIIHADESTSAYFGDGFVAIHCDGSTSAAARGASVGYQTAEGASFAAMWKDQYHQAGWSGFRPDNYTPSLAGYYGVRNAVVRGNRTAFIAECGFLTSPTDEALLTPPAGADRFARALAASVAYVFGTPNLPTEEDDMTPEECREIVHEELYQFERLPTFWVANDVPGRENHWYKVWGTTKVLQTKDQAAGAVANSLAEWPGTSAENPGGTGWPGGVPQHQLDGFQTLGSDFYPWEPEYPGVRPPTSPPAE
jgi:hypothetical protein